MASVKDRPALYGAIKGRVMEILTENWLSFSAGVFLLGMVLYGHYRGFLKTVVTLATLVISVVVVRFATPHITTLLRENTEIRHKIERVLTDAAGFSRDSQDIQMPAQQRLLIEQLKLPRQMKEALLENNNHEIYHILGVDTFFDYVGTYLVNMILNFIGSIVLFILVNLFIRFLVRWADLIARLPVLSGLNQIAGALLGGIQGLLCLWACFVLADLFSRSSWALAILDQVNKSTWLTFLYNNNLINWMFVNILKSLI